MPTIAEALKKATSELKPYGILALDLRLLVMHDEGFKEQIDVLANRDKEMKQYPLFLSQIERLKKDEPVEYIINDAEFLGRHLYVDPRVLIPRSETEELVADITERIGDYYDPRNYLVCADIGTGSGAIALALKDAFPNWLLLASDASKDAFDVAKMNFSSSGVNIDSYLGDGLAPYIENKLNLDIIVSNPPYILDPKDAQDSVRNYEPSSALWLDKENSLYEKIFRDSSRVKRGTLYMAFEISPDLTGYLEELMKRYLKDYEYDFVKDLNGLVRFLFVYCK
jgi:release factor glutamine methyltransferase